MDDTVLFGLMGMHISYHNLTSKLLSELSLTEVSSIFNVPVSVETQVSEAIHMTKPSKARGLVLKWTERLNSIGGFLVSRGFQTPAKLFIFIVKECRQHPLLVRKGLSEHFDFVKSSGKLTIFFPFL